MYSQLNYVDPSEELELQDNVVNERDPNEVNDN